MYIGGYEGICVVIYYITVKPVCNFEICPDGHNCMCSASKSAEVALP